MYHPLETSTDLYNAERQARKLWILIFICFGVIRPGIDLVSSVLKEDAFFPLTTDRLWYRDMVTMFQAAAFLTWEIWSSKKPSMQIF